MKCKINAVLGKAELNSATKEVAPVPAEAARYRLAPVIDRENGKVCAIIPGIFAVDLPVKRVIDSNRSVFQSYI
jgi:hypothetical protein